MTSQLVSSTPSPATDRPSWRRVNLRALARIEDLPSLSTVVAEFLDLARQEYFTAKDFEAVISKDQALVARLLKLANSGMYGKARNIHSIPEAVVLVGLEQMKKIVFAVSTEGLTRLRLRNYAYEPARGYWMHSTAVGLAARAVAEAIPDHPLHGEEAFVAGLLHDVGKLIVDDFLDPEPGKRRVTLDEEQDAVGLNHAELAEHILNQWKLPTSIVEAVRLHHADSAEAAATAGAQVLKFAQAIVRTWDIGFKEPVDLSPEFDAGPYADIVAALDLPVSRLDQILWDIRQNLAGIEMLYPDD